MGKLVEDPELQDVLLLSGLNDFTLEDYLPAVVRNHFEDWKILNRVDVNLSNCVDYYLKLRNYFMQHLQ